MTYRSAPPASGPTKTPRSNLTMGPAPDTSRVSGLGSRVSGGSRVLGSRVSGRGSRVAGRGSRGLGVSGLGVSGLGSRVSGFGWFRLEETSLNLFSEVETCQSCTLQGSAWVRLFDHGQWALDFFIEQNMCLIARRAFLCKAALITLLRLPPARQCCLPTTRCGVGPSAEQHCPRLTSCVKSCLPCVHVQDKLSICRLPSQKNSRNVAHLQIEGVCGAIGYTDGCELDCLL